MIKRSMAPALLGLILLAAACAGARAADDPIHFLIIQPGSPGTTEEAAPLMARLAEYLSTHSAGKPTVEGLYVNTLNDVERAIRKLQPRIAIVTLPYYLEQRVRLGLRVQLATRPGGRTEDHYRLLVAATNPATSWEAVKGDVAGTLCFTADAVARLLFQRPATALPFHCQPTDRLLRAARQVVQGELSGLLLTDEQYTSLQTLPEGKSLKELHATPPLPPSLVVSFGTPDGGAKALTKTMVEMKNDPAAHDLLTELRTDGFEPIDPRRLTPLYDAFDQAGKGASKKGAPVK
jgi:hypothetical protein